MTNPAGYPVTEYKDGNLTLNDSSGIGLYGILTAAKIIAPVVAGLGPTADQTGVKDTLGLAAGIAAANGGPGIITMAPGTYYVDTGMITALQSSGTIFIQGSGIGTTVIKALGSGDCIRMYNPNSPAGGFPGLSVYGGGILDLTIDGSLASAGATGLHIGDGEHYRVRIQIQHFNGAGSTGLHIENSVWWTEKGDWDVTFVDCTNAVTHTTSSGNNSNAENNFNWTFFLLPNQNAITMTGIVHYLGRLNCRGVFNAGGGSNSGVFLTGDAASGINNCQVDVSMNLGASGASPQTMSTVSGFTFGGNFGRWVFGGAAGWTAGNRLFSSDQTGLSFAGAVIGDTSVNPASAIGGPGTQALVVGGSPIVYAPGFMAQGSGKIDDMSGDFFSIRLTGSITVALGGTGTKGSVPGPQHKVIIIQQAHTAGPFTVTWPHNSVPTTTTPKVIWAGGVAPTMTATADGIDKYSLDTFDGATWYGTAAQALA